MKLRHLLVIPAVALVAACNNPVAHDGDHARDVAGVELFDRSAPATRVAGTVGQGGGIAWDGALPVVRAGESRTFDIRWVNAAGQTLALGDRYASRVRFAADGRNTGDAVRENATLRLASEPASVTVTGRAAGEADVVVVLWHGSHDDWVSPPLRVQVAAP